MALFDPPSSRESEEFLGTDVATRALSVAAVENDFVARVYENIAWAYDLVFGPSLHPGRVQAIQSAFRDVSNALVAYRKNREFRVQQEHLVEAAQDAARLSEVRFKVGTTDYLEVLTNNTNSFTAELGLAQAQGNELTALVQLYQALGGGWQQ